MSPTRRSARRSLARRRVPRAAALALPLVSLTACSAEDWSRAGLPEGITEQSNAVQSLWNGSWIAALGTGVVVWGLILWSVAFHRKRKNSPHELPPQVRYNLPIEILYTVIPIIMVGVFFFFTARDQNYITTMSDKPDVTVKVEGYQWSWRFTTEANGKTIQQAAGLPAENYLKGPQLVLPAGRSVKFQLSSPDVIHSFWIPAFHFKLDVIPGVDNRFEVRTLDKEGVFAGRCAELCGVDHSRMLFSVKLVKADEFDRYIASQAGVQ